MLFGKTLTKRMRERTLKDSEIYCMIANVTIIYVLFIVIAFLGSTFEIRLDYRDIIVYGCKTLCFD